MEVTLQSAITLLKMYNTYMNDASMWVLVMYTAALFNISEKDVRAKLNDTY